MLGMIGRAGEDSRQNGLREHDSNLCTVLDTCLVLVSFADAVNGTCPSAAPTTRAAAGALQADGYSTSYHGAGRCEMRR